MISKPVVELLGDLNEQNNNYRIVIIKLLLILQQYTGLSIKVKHTDIIIDVSL